jgi:large subunit ribosomal protein L30e
MKMGLTEDVQAAVKAGKAVIGYRRSLKEIKSGKPKLVVIANNMPQDMRVSVEKNANVSKLEVKTFEGTSTQLGIICGKSFPISTLVIKS